MQSAAVLKARIESALGAPSLTWREHREPEYLASGIPGIELPRGAIVDVFGRAGSGRTSLLVSALAEATSRQEACALVDASDAFDPASAEAAGVDLERLLWVRCGHPEKALKTADLLIQAGGFGLVVLDFAGIPAAIARRIPLASWFRFRRAIENTPAVLLVVEQEPTAKSCAALILELKHAAVEWSGARGCSDLLRGTRIDAAPRKPARAQAVRFDTRALA